MKTAVPAAALAVALASVALAPAALAQSHDGHAAGHASHTADVSGTGIVKSVDTAKRTVTLSHEPIPAIGWPAMTMDMAVADGIDLAGVPSGARIAFTLTKGGDGIYMIDSIKAK